MKLNVQERLMLLNILPKESDFITLKLVTKLQGELSFSEEEIKKLNFKSDVTKDGQPLKTWDIKQEVIIEIEIGEKMTEIISEQLKKLNDEKKLGFNHFSLNEKFIKE